VDDEDSVRALLGAVVRSEGGTPRLAASGVEAYAALAAAPGGFALIILDVSMPEMDGFRFRALQLEDPALARVPVVMLTGHALTASELALMRPAAVLTKPAPLAAIREVIQQYVAHPAP
jgi:CheY-like chemotaxis protein